MVSYCRSIYYVNHLTLSAVRYNVYWASSIQQLQCYSLLLDPFLVHWKTFHTRRWPSCKANVNIRPIHSTFDSIHRPYCNRLLEFLCDRDFATPLLVFGNPKIVHIFRDKPTCLKLMPRSKLYNCDRQSPSRHYWVC